MSGSTFWNRIKLFYFRVSPSLLEYHTPRTLLVRCRYLGMIYTLMRVLVLVYVIGYVLVHSKSYQSIDEPDSSIISKVKGILRRHRNGREEVWDSQDYVIPPVLGVKPLERTIKHQVLPKDESLKLLTIHLQPQDIGSGTGEGRDCTRDSHCTRDKEVKYGNGIQTGICNRTTSTCQIRGWCPVEVDTPPSKPTLSGFDTVTIMVKNYINFPRFDVRRSNMLSHFSAEYLKECRYHPKDDPYCPIFPLVQIVKDAEKDLDVAKIAVKGGVISFNIEWKCDLDYDEEYCRPKYSFKRLDDQHAKVSTGWNFRHPYYYYDRDNVFRRDVVKFWGIRIVFDVHGKAGRFSIILMLIHVGSAMGLFGIASMVCEFLLNSCMITPTLDDHKTLRLEELLESIRPPRPNSPRLSMQRQITTTDSFQLREKLLKPFKTDSYDNGKVNTWIDRDTRTSATSLASVKPVETYIDMEPVHDTWHRPHSAPTSPLYDARTETLRNLSPNREPRRPPDSLNVLVNRNAVMNELRNPYRHRNQEQYWV
ncbi:P2X purinoceptor 4-like isoform X2 [Paramacrobiotus metropolitanus]|uniref:P2X purinoceptor 4-like isoform X2 n=1 Tax=Paramacrobiotus metropolitanus TaxID=2943436 RepID=UPI00244628AA|nr:P2X purinoceptor 4-like isoform X2 [Paramacrobiotus metropolitanus]